MHMPVQLDSAEAEHNFLTQTIYFGALFLTSLVFPSFHYFREALGSHELPVPSPKIVKRSLFV